MTDEELRKVREQKISRDLQTSENLVRHAFNQGYELGYQQHGKDFVENGEKAYQKGLEDGKQVGYDKGYEDGAQCQDEVQYQKGMENIWNALLTSFDMSADDRRKIFTTPITREIVRKYTAHDFIEKVKEWEQNQQQTDDFKVGDEVTDYQGNIFYVVDICDGYTRCWNKEGMSVPLVDGGLKKTGKHIDGIAEVLKQMQEGEE